MSQSDHGDFRHAMQSTGLSYCTIKAHANIYIYIYAEIYHTDTPTVIIVHIQLNSANEENTTQNKNQEGFIFSFNNIYRLYTNKALQAAIF